MGRSELARLRATLEDSLAQSGLSKTQLVARSGLSRTTVYHALQPVSPAPSASTVAALAHALGLPKGDLLDRLRRAAGEASSDVQERGDRGEGPGQSIVAWNPHDLEVHRAIGEQHADAGAQNLMALPSYVRREHDAVLDDLVAAVGAGHSRMAVLVGSSSTGKSRACWEAVQPLAAAGWRLWHPIAPTHAQALQEGLSAVRPCTVLWLNETHNYVGGALGEGVAAALRELLRDVARSPVLVLGTMWEERWREILHDPPSGEADLHAQRRALLDGVSVRVPDRFGGSALRALRAQAALDVRLAEALERAPQGQVAQYLGGGPALEERYATAPALERALLDAAIDACRLGHGPWLPRPLLENAVALYLLEQEAQDAAPVMVTDALDALCRPVRGGRGPLSRVQHSAVGAEVGLEGYRLADYLEQRGRRSRASMAAPAGLWEVLLKHGEPASLLSVSNAADARGFSRLSVALCCAAVRGGIAGARSSAAQLLRANERWKELALWCQEGAAAGDGEATAHLVSALAYTGRADEALVWCERAANHGQHDVLNDMGWILGQIGRREEALCMFERAAAAGCASAGQMVALTLESSGRIDEALELYRARSAQGSVHDALAAARLMEYQGRWEEARDLLLAHNQDAGSDDSTLILAALLRQISQQSGWLEQFTKSIDADFALSNAHVMATLYAWADHPEEARVWTARAAEAGDASSMASLAQHHEADGDHEEAGRWYRRAIEAGHGPSRARLARLLDQQGDTAAALTLYRQAARARDATVLARLSELITAVEGQSAAFDWLVAHADAAMDTAGDSQPRTVVLKLLQEAGHHDRALEWLHDVAQADDDSAWLDVPDVLYRAGRADDAERMRRYGWEPDGSISTPWTVSQLTST